MAASTTDREAARSPRLLGSMLLVSALGVHGMRISDEALDATSQQTPLEAAERVRERIGGGLTVCILGGTRFQGADSEALVKAIAQRSAGVGRNVSFVTGGMDGVQRTFAQNCGDGSNVWNLLPLGQSSGYGTGTDVHAGKDLEERKLIFALVGDVYITVEGGPGVAQEARGAVARGAAVLPLARTGGASSGMFDFPSAALDKPPFTTQAQWNMLLTADAAVDAAAVAVVDIVKGFT